MIDISSSLKDDVAVVASELVASGKEMLKLPNDEVFISLTREHAGFLCFGDQMVQGKKIYILHKR